MFPNTLLIVSSRGILVLISFIVVTASRSTSEGLGTNNLPPLQFHNVRGDHIRLYRNATVARRVESFCKGIAFSARPVKVNEKVISYLFS